MSTRLLKFSEAILEAQAQCLEDPSVLLIGEGVPDPKSVFGTTKGLKEKFPNQVFDMPVSENGMTGVCIGAALNGFKPILVHMRIDFSLYSADQLINNAAKWYQMFGGQKSVPMVIRMIIGRGWGAGVQHSQNLTALYSHIPGLKIFIPSNAADAKSLFIRAVRDPNPVLFIEHRWLHNTTSAVDPTMNDLAPENIGIYSGDGLTIISSGHETKEVRLAYKHLSKHGIRPEILDICVMKPLNRNIIIDSVRKTKHLLVVDSTWKSFGIAAEILASVAESGVSCKMSRLTIPDYYASSSPALIKNYYPSALDICLYACRLIGVDNLDFSELKKYQDERPIDVPDDNFKGPF